MSMEKTEEAQETPSLMTYVVGSILVIAVVAGAWYFRSKASLSGVIEPMGQAVPVATPTPGPITGLGCDVQYYNPRLGFNEYYLSAEGGDIVKADRVNCTFTASVNGKEVATATAQSPLTDAPQRGGKTFRCTTKTIALEPSVETIIDVVLKDDLRASATCSATFTFAPQQ